MINFSLRELKFSGNMFFSYPERLASAKVGKSFRYKEMIRKSHCLKFIIYLALKESILKNYQINR